MSTKLYTTNTKHVPQTKFVVPSSPKVEITSKPAMDRLEKMKKRLKTIQEGAVIDPNKLTYNFTV